LQRYRGTVTNLCREVFMSELINWAQVERKVLSEKRVKAGLRAEELRERMDPEPIIKQMLALVREADNVEVADIPRLKFKADVLTTILKKVMPDLRSLEVTEKDSKHSTLIIQMEGFNKSVD
jgi:hypothetical protein